MLGNGLNTSHTMTPINHTHRANGYFFFSLSIKSVPSSPKMIVSDSKHTSAFPRGLNIPAVAFRDIQKSEAEMETEYIYSIKANK